MKIERKEETQGIKEISPRLPPAYGRKRVIGSYQYLALESRKIIEFQTKRKSLDTGLIIKEKKKILGGIYKFI